MEALRAEKPRAHWRAVRDCRSGWVGQIDDVGTDAGPSSTQAFGFVVRKPCPRRRRICPRPEARWPKRECIGSHELGSGAVSTRR